MNQLAKALSESARLVGEALENARKELASLNQRKAELEALIAEAEAIQRTRNASGTLPQRLTLHDALAAILREEGNRWMTVRELADAVNERGLYRKKDGSTVEMNQIHARTKNYSDLFDKEGPNVRLRLDNGEPK